MKGILIGNSFPFSLIRRPVSIRPRDTKEMIKRMQSMNWTSFWGHENTLTAASEVLGSDIRPKSERPALQLSSDGFPMLEGESFDEAWILSPCFKNNFRPSIGQELHAEDVENWQVLQIKWEGFISDV
jgi:hypothetical protein